MPGSADADFELSEATAKTLRLRKVCFEPHFGQSIFSELDIDFTSRSKRLLHDLHVYS
jgi:hypothetical protein